MLKGYVNEQNISSFAAEKLGNDLYICFVNVVKLDDNCCKLCGLFLDGLPVFIGQNPWLLASVLVLNCSLALDQPLNPYVSASPSGKKGQ